MKKVVQSQLLDRTTYIIFYELKKNYNHLYEFLLYKKMKKIDFFFWMELTNDNKEIKGKTDILSYLLLYTGK